jgi:CheY-like chemotaxis protein/HPt (histidine-containing phosphotransfer) domain-containing protein
LNLVNDVLDFSKIEAGKVELEVVDFDLYDIVENVAGMVAPGAAAKGLELTSLIDPELPRTFRGDPFRLRQILANLAANAVKFTERGEVVLRAKRCAQTEDGMTIRFEVADTGIGIANEKQSYLFEAFAQADLSTTRKYGGTGLGLAISSQLVKLMEGEIGVDSEPGKGSIFWFTVPLALSSGQVQRQEQMRPDIPSVPQDRTNMMAAPQGGRILIAEDNVVNQQVAIGVLAALGYRSDVAANGREAVEATDLVPYAAILMDCQMPEMDGYQATREIRRREGTGPHTPIIALTADVSKGARAKSLSAGMDDHITKPLNPQELAAALGRWLRRVDELESQAVAAQPRAEGAAGHIALDGLRELERTGAPGLVKKITDLFLLDTPRQLTDLRDSVQNGDSVRLVKVAHTLKGSAANLGAREMVRICAELQVLGEAENISIAPSLVADLESQFGSVRDAILSEGATG